MRSCVKSRRLIIFHNQVPSDDLLSPEEEKHPCSNGNGLTAKTELDHKRENGLTAPSGVRLKFVQEFSKTEVSIERKYFH